MISYICSKSGLNVDINKIDYSISFSAFYRSSKPCIKYLSKNFDGNISEFDKALITLDERCSGHKHFDMFFSPEDSSIKIFPKVHDKSSQNNYISVYSNSEYDSHLRYLANDKYLHEFSGKNIIKRILYKIFDFFNADKVKKFVVQTSYDKLPSNVREAVDLIEKMEHAL